jgi:hypothetical protein
MFTQLLVPDFGTDQVGTHWNERSCPRQFNGITQARHSEGSFEPMQLFHAESAKSAEFEWSG